MLRFKKILLSLILCLILLAGSVFATTMSESDIKSFFNTNYSEEITVDSSLYYNFNDIYGVVSDIAEEDEMVLTNNYIVFVYDDSGYGYFEYYDMGNYTVDSIFDSYGNPLFSLTGNVNKYYGYCSAGNVSVEQVTATNVIDFNLLRTYKGNTFKASRR